MSQIVINTVAVIVEICTD